MNKTTTTKIIDNDYSYIVSFLSWEVNVDTLLSRMKLPEGRNTNILVDLALVSGPGEFRFAKYSTDEEGRISPGSKSFVTPSPDVEKTANMILAKFKNHVAASFLTDSQKQQILRMPYGSKRKQI